MNENELHEQLMDYVEGNISSRQKAEVESSLSKSPQMQNDLELIQSALNDLRNIPIEDVPPHYFTNFLPRLRQRLDSGNVHLPFLIPDWFRFFSAPAVVSVFVISIVLMYQSFRPEELQSPIFSMVNSMERMDINSIVDETADLESTPGVIRSIENLAGDISSINAIESKFSEDLLVLDVSNYQTDHELLSDMSDREIEQVLDRLDMPTIR